MFRRILKWLERHQSVRVTRITKSSRPLTADEDKFLNSIFEEGDKLIKSVDAFFKKL